MAEGTDQAQARFSGIQRLYGRDALSRLTRAHVCVVGVGGVGSWAVEALARSGVGQLTLVDFDDVCVTNVNRQVPALDGSFGKPKVEELARRILAIHPECQVHSVREFFTASNAARLLQPNYNYVIDAIDDVDNKCLLIASCRQRGIPIVTVGGAGGRRRSTAVKVEDLSRAHQDKLLQQVRKRLRSDHDFPRDPSVLFGVDCVFSPEAVVYPQDDGSVCTSRPDGARLKLDCQSGFGTASFVTGAFGFAAAGWVVSRLAVES